MGVNLETLRVLLEHLSEDAESPFVPPLKVALATSVSPFPPSKESLLSNFTELSVGAAPGYARVDITEWGAVQLDGTNGRYFCDSNVFEFTNTDTVNSWPTVNYVLLLNDAGDTLLIWQDISGTPSITLGPDQTIERVFRLADDTL